MHREVSIIFSINLVKSVHASGFVTRNLISCSGPPTDKSLSLIDTFKACHMLTFGECHGQLAARQIIVLLKKAHRAWICM